MKEKQNNFTGIIIGLTRILLAMCMILLITLMFVLLGTATYKLIKIAMLSVGKHVYWIWGIVVILSFVGLSIRQYCREIGEKNDTNN